MAVSNVINDKAARPNDIPFLREWTPLTELLEKIPTRIQCGLFSHYVKFTCIDVLPEFLVIGTNLGVLFWCDRKTKDIQRLRCENGNIPVTTVKVISTVDYMVAAGSKDGNISIFQIPKFHPDSIPESLKPKQKKIERYTVSELHKAQITAVEWSKNGMKLFSGDKSGCIVYTEIDFYMHICKSVEILNEAYEVVQLSYVNQRLLVSTTYRSILCQKLDKWKVCQVGKKDRKILGNFGGIIYQNGIRPSDTILYCTRPGLRIWISDIEGNVEKTLLFKDILNKGCPEVPVINPISRSLQSLKPQKEPNFGALHIFKDNFLVTCNNDIIYILDPQEMCVLYKMSYLRSILSITTYKKELFILEEERNIIRISDHPETTAESNSPISSYTSTSPVNPLKNLTSKFNGAPIISAIPPLFEQALGGDTVLSDNNVETSAEEAREVPLAIDTIPKTEKTFDDIGKQVFNDRILFKKTRHRRKSVTSASTNSLSSTSSEERDATYIRPTVMNLSTIGVLPDLRSPESIQNDIEYKEKILADILNLEKIKIPPDIPSTPDVLHEKDDTKIQDESSCDNEIINTYNFSRIQIYDKLNTPAIQSEPEQTDICPTGSSNCDDKDLRSHISEIPDCHTIPNDWKLSEIYLKTVKDESLSDNSLNDWEIV